MGGDVAWEDDEGRLGGPLKFRIGRNRDGSSAWEGDGAAVGEGEFRVLQSVRHVIS